MFDVMADMLFCSRHGVLCGQQAVWARSALAYACGFPGLDQPRGTGHTLPSEQHSLIPRVTLACVTRPHALCTLGLSTPLFPGVPVASLV